MVSMIQLKSRDEWLQHRKSRIGGSEASAIVGMNPYMTNVDLWEYKTGRKRPVDISDKDYVQYGIKAEDHLRELFKLDHPEYEVFYEENNMWPDLKFSLARCLSKKFDGTKTCNTPAIRKPSKR